ncbi:Nuclear pore complex protein NUP214-like protein [Drosera capensis]
MGAESSGTVTAIDDESQCDRIHIVDYYFHRIGAAVPITAPSTPFDLANPPIQPLAVSERRGLVFVGHGEGFCVARTRDVVELAKEMKEKGGGGVGCVVERCVVDVRVGRVGVLEVSRGEEMVAVAVEGEVHFFEVEALMNEEEKPFYSCSVHSDFVKSICWSRKMRNAFIFLSGSGKLYKGVVGEPLQDGMDDVDAATEKYMEGIIKQTTDGQYWDLWQSQRLSSELEVRRKNILNMNENLINRLSDLEKHFNALELNPFGGKEVDAVGRRPLLSRSSPSGNIQSLRAVQNAMTSQLAAAEQLSECLSRQMTALNMKSPEM